MFRSLNLTLVLFVLVIFNIFTFSRAGWFSGNNFNEWLDILTGVKSSPNEAKDFALDKIHKSIRDWQKKGPKYSDRIPKKLKHIGYTELEFCHYTLESMYEPELTQSGNLKSPGARYYRFFAKMQYNLCLQEFEFKRILMASQILNNAHWVAWFDAWAASDHASDSKDIRVPVQKLARYLKLFVPRIDIGSVEEQTAKVDREIKAMIGQVCPFVTGNRLQQLVNIHNIKYFGETRANVDADPEPFVWSSSRRICTNRSLEDEFVKSVANHMITQLDKIHMEDQNINDISDPKIISEIVFAGKGSTIRAGNPIELLERLAQLPEIKEQKPSVGELLELRQLYADDRVCNPVSIYKRDRLYESLRNNEVLGRYVNSMNALQFNLCDRKTRLDVANLAHGIPPVQLARLNELRDLIKKYHSSNAASNGQFINPSDGFGRATQELVDRYVPLTGRYNDEDFDYRHNIVITLMNDDSVKKHLTRVHGENQVNEAKKNYDSVMSKTCVDVTATLSEDHLNSLNDMLRLEPNEKLGELTISLFDYWLICKYADENGFNQVLEALKNKRQM